MSEQSVAVHEGEGTPLRLHVYTSPTASVIGPGDRTFSPTTSTLISGERDAVLVDSGFLTKDVAALGDMIEQSGKQLTTIFITHGHGDHFYGSAQLAHRFPGVSVVASPGVVAYIDAHLAESREEFRAMFGEAVASPDLLPSPLASDTILLEGHELKVHDIGQGDIKPSTVLHVPGLNALIVGDIAYNGIHVMLALGGPEQWHDWITSIDALEQLDPSLVIVGHKRPEASDADVSRILGGTRQYIQDFAAIVETAGSTRDVVTAMVAKYPDHGNLPTLLWSASVAVKARKT